MQSVLLEGKCIEIGIEEVFCLGLAWVLTSELFFLWREKINSIFIQLFIALFVFDFASRTIELRFKSLYII